ncbi:importin-4 [Agelaius tricolor]|uniref:importin-4 n=1 Tax=Agelaius tricolor TaxID=9191 RepID=UPI0039F1E1FE
MAAPSFSKMAAPALEQILTDLLEPDSAGIRQATERLREALEEPEGPEGLAELLRGAGRPQIRQLAAVLLRRRLRKLPQELIDRLPHVVVEALERETDSCSRGALGQLGARLLLLGGPKFWEPLEKWIQEAARDPQKMEGALSVVGVALAVAGPALSPRGPALLSLIRAGLGALRDPGSVGAALRALRELLPVLGHKKTNLLRSLVPEVLAALEELLSLDEDRGANALEVLDEFLETNPESLIPHLRPMLELCLQVAKDECRGDTVRVRALATLTFLAQKRPRALLRGLLVPLYLAGGGGAALPPPRSRSVAAAGGAGSGRLRRRPQGGAAGAGRARARLRLRPAPAVSGRGPGGPAGRAGRPRGRRQGGGGRGPEGAERGTGGEGVQPWLPQVLPRILAALEAPEEPRGRELALSALHALASGPGPLPLPSPLIGAVTALARGGEEQLQALEVLAALGPAHVGEGLLEALELGLALAEDGDTEATRVTLALLAAVSELLGEGTAPLLPRLLRVLQGALRPPPPPSDAPDWLLGLHDDQEGAEPMEDDSAEWAEPEEAEVGGAFPGLAEAALGALGELAENCGSAFLPYLEPSLAAILDLTQFPQFQVRGAAYEALGSLCCCGRDAQTGPSPPHHEAFRALLGGLRKDPEVGGALAAVGGVGRILQPPGHAHKEWLEPIGRALCDVITGEVACLKSQGDDDEETSQRAELRETASDWLPEVGVAMAREGVAGTGGGVAFPPRLFRRILPSLLAALADPAHPGARSWAAAVIGQLGHALGEEATPFLADLGTAFRLAVGDADDEVRANSFYAIGRIGEAVGHAHNEGAWPGAELCGHALRAGGEGPGRVRDNAVAALVRHRGLPWQRVLPLVLGALPLSADLEEEEPVLRFLQEMGPERLLPHVPEFVGGVGPALALGRLQKDLSQSLLALLRQVGGADPQSFRVGVASLDPAHAAILCGMLDDVIGGQ